jgi:tripartite-type tricarboxylate transporter receptor subunit TctC
METAQIWWGLFGPAGLPGDIVTKMNAELNKALEDPAFKALAAKSGATPAPTTPEDFTAAIHKELAALEAFLKTVNAG